GLYAAVVVIGVMPGRVVGAVLIGLYAAVVVIGVVPGRIVRPVSVGLSASVVIIGVVPGRVVGSSSVTRSGMIAVMPRRGNGSPPRSAHVVIGIMAGWVVASLAGRLNAAVVVIYVVRRSVVTAPGQSVNLDPLVLEMLVRDVLNRAQSR